MHAATIARMMQIPQIMMTRRSTSDDSPGTSDCCRAGPIDTATGSPSVVEAFSIS